MIVTGAGRLSVSRNGEDMVDHFRRLMRELKEVSPILGRQVLVFPVIVVLMASVTFLFGGHCSAWQWWGAVLAVMALPFGFHRDIRKVVLADGWLALGLGALWVLSGVIMTTGGHDANVYHLPAIRMLIKGWNPIMSPTPESLLQSVGVDPTTLHQFHVISMPKAVWYFSAVAYFFTGQAFDLLLPLYAFVFVAATATVWGFFQSKTRFVRVMAILILFSTGQGFNLLVDAVVGFAGIGLILTMVDCLRNRTWDWWRLLVFSFWMCESKHLGVVSCLVFWTLFAIALLVVRFPARYMRLAVVASVMFFTTLVVCYSPYITSWKSFGHPLYPAMSTNTEQFSLVDLSEDFHRRNDDARAMGRLGHLINAYVSSKAACLWYGWKLGKNNFAPRVTNWEQCLEHGDESPTPTKTHFKLIFCISCLIVLFLGGGAERLGVGMVIAGIAAFPTEMIGYLRYVPWLAAVYLLAFDAMAGLKEIKERRVVCCLFILYFMVFGLAESIVMGAYGIDAMFAAKRMLVQGPSPVIYLPYAEKQHGRGCWRCKLANVQLLCEEVTELQEAECILLPLWDTPIPKTDYEQFFDTSFWVKRTGQLGKWSRYRRIRDDTGNEFRKKVLAMPRFVAETYLVTLPKALIYRFFH